MCGYCESSTVSCVEQLLFLVYDADNRRTSFVNTSSQGVVGHPKPDIGCPFCFVKILASKMKNIVYSFHVLGRNTKL
jgi:hypothetical protein